MQCAAAAHLSSSHTKYLYLSSSEQAYGAIRQGRLDDWLLGGAYSQLVGSGQWKLVYSSGDARVLQHV